jgi:hypothetical protein
MNNNLQFTIQSYLRLASLCDECDERRNFYIKKAEALLETFQNPPKKVSPVYSDVKEIVSQEGERQYMTVSDFMSLNPQLKKYSPELVAKALNECGIYSERRSINCRQQRCRLLPVRK